MSVGDLQDVTITEADEFGNIRPTVTSTGSPPEPVYLNVSFVFAPSGEAESGAFRYSIPGGVTTVIPAGTVIGQSIDYEAGYEIAPEDATHVFTHIVGHGATIPEAGDVLKAGNFLMEITGAGGVHIEGSPFEMRFETRADQAAFRIENSFAYGPGITLLPGDENTPAGTVRKGEAKPFFVQLRDTYGNVLTRRPKGQVNIRVQLFEPSALTGELGDAIRDFGCQEELVDGSYEGLYRCERAYCECTSTPCKTTCYSYMVIKVTAAGQGVLPAANYSVADPNVVLDEDPVGSILYEYQDGEGRRFPVTDGVVVKLLSGEASPGDSFADDPDCNIASRQRGGGRGCQARITGGTNWGNMTAGDNLNFRVRLFDKFQQPKTDMDEGSNVLVRLYMMRDQFGTSIGIQPWLGTELDAPEDADGNPVWASVRHPRNLGFDVFSRNITVTAPPDSTGTMRIDPSNYGYTPEGIVLPRAGFYELHVLFVKENPDAPDGFEEIHFAEGTIRGSPYNIYVAPGKSDPSSLPSQANLGEAATGTPGAINTPAAASRRRLAGLPVATVTDPRIERALRQLRSDRVVPVNKRLYSDTPLMTGSRNAARRLAQTVAEEEPARISFEVPAGEVYDLVLDLKDSIGNQQVFSPLKPLDTALVRIGDVLEGAKPCVWLPLDPDRLDLTQRIDTVNSDDECQVVHTGFDFETLCQSTADGCPADVSLKQQNDIAMGKLTMQFTVEANMPAVMGKAYLMGISLNGTPLAGSPFEIRVVPGPVYGPTCEVVRWHAAEEGLGDPIFVAGTRSQLVFQARDQYGNDQFTNNEPSNFLVEMSLRRRGSSGATQIIRGCTTNANSSTSCFGMLVGPYNADAAPPGQYAITFNSLVSSGINNADFSLTMRYCPDPSRCSSRQNFYNLNDPPGVTVYTAHTVKVNPAATFASECVAYGPDLTDGGVSGQQATFVIEARDRYSNRRLEGGDIFETIVYAPRNTIKISSGSAGANGERIVDNNDGTYVVYMLPEDPGRYTALIQLLRGPEDELTPATHFGFIRGSPFNPEYRLIDGNIAPAASRVVDELGLTLSALPSAPAGEDVRVLIQAYTVTTSNRMTPKKSGGDVVQAQLTIGIVGGGGRVIDLEVTDHQISPEPPNRTAGRYTALIPGDLIKTAQDYTLIVKACEAANPSSSITSRTCATGKQLQHIRGSPFIVLIDSGPMMAENSFVVELADPSRYINDGQGWEAGLVSTFTVQPRDVYNNNGSYDPLTSPEIAFELSATITGQSSGRVWERVSNTDPAGLQDGEYMVTTTFEGFYLFSFRADLAERVKVEVMQRDIVMRNSGAIVTVRPGALDVTNCIIDRTIGDFPVGETHIFILTTRDAYGNNLPEGGTDFEVELSLDNAFTEPGIGDNPLQAQSKSAADFIDVPDPDNPSNVIQVNQFNRNATYTYTGSGVNDPSVVVHMNLHIQDLLNGKYQVSYMSEAAGQATLSVRASTPAADGTLTTASVCTSESAFAWCSRLATIEGGSFRLAFEPLGPTADPDNMHSYIFSDLRHHEEIAAGSTATIVIRAFDMFKNPVTSDGFQFTSTLSLEGSEQRRLLGALDYVSCGAPEDGLCDGQVPNESYVIQYNPTKVGAYTLDVKRSGASLRSLGSDGTFRLLPFGPVAGETGFVVRPGPLDPDTTTITHRVNYVVNRRQDGAAHLALYAVAGVPETFYISGYDEFGNALTRGGEQPVVTIGLLYEGKVTDQQNGTYEVQYTVPAANVYQMEVKINQRRISLCERCRIVGFPTNIDGEAVTSRFFDSATSSFELHVNPATPVPSEFVALTSEVGAIAGVPTSIDVQVFDAFSNLISPSMGLWQCAERSQSDVCVESGAIVQPSVSVYAKILRRVVDEEDPTNTDGVNEPMPSNFPGVRNDDWSFRISYTLNTTGVYDIEFFGSVAGSAAVKFDSTEDGAVCPTDSDPDRVCASIDENPEVQPGLLDPATVAIEGNGLRPADDVFLDSGDGVDLAATITPTDELGNLLVAIDDGVFEADVRLDTARLPLEGHMTALASNAETSASFIQSVLLGKAVEGGTADSSGNGIGVSVFTPDDVLPGALDEVKHVNVTYTPTRAGKMSVAFRYLNLHVTGSPFVLFVSPGDIGGEIPAADDADARAGHALFCTDGNTCTEVMGFDQETCQQKGACSPGKLANHLEGQTARFEIIPRDIYGNSITAAGIRDGTVASKLAHCTGTHDIDCPIRARSSFATGDTPVTRSSYGDPGTWVEDSGAAPSERPTVTWDDERNIVIVRVPMFLPAGATGEVTVNITLHACRVDELSDSSCEDSKLTLDDIGLKLVSLTGGTAISLNVVQATPEQIQGIKLASDDGGHPLTLASGVGLAGSIAGTPGKFIVYAVAKVCTKDLSFGAPANPADVDYTPCSEDAWVSVPSPYEQTLTPSIVPAEGGDPLDATVTHNPDATYVVSYTGTATGDYVATLTVEGARLPIFLSSEIPTQGTITVFSGPASLAQSEVALASSTVAAGSQAFASVTLRDQHGNLAVPRDFVLLQDIIQASVEYTGPLELTLDQEALLSSSLVTTNNLDGTHSVLFNTRIAGNYSVSLFLLGESTVDSETGETAAVSFGERARLSVPSGPSVLPLFSTLCLSTHRLQDGSLSCPISFAPPHLSVNMSAKLP